MSVFVAAARAAASEESFREMPATSGDFESEDEARADMMCSETWRGACALTFSQGGFDDLAGRNDYYLYYYEILRVIE